MFETSLMCRMSSTDNKSPDPDQSALPRTGSWPQSKFFRDLRETSRSSCRILKIGANGLLNWRIVDWATHRPKSLTVGELKWFKSSQRCICANSERVIRFTEWYNLFKTSAILICLVLNTVYARHRQPKEITLVPSVQVTMPKLRCPWESHSKVELEFNGDKSRYIVTSNIQRKNRKSRIS